MADNPLKYDPVKAATASSLIKQGFTEEQAFDKAGITEAEYGTYSIDDVPGSPTRGRVIKGLAATDYTEEQAAQNKAASDARKKLWTDEEVKAETTGPVETRTTSSVVTTGGAERVTKMTPEMSNWVDKSNTAAAADEAATQAAKQEYLRTQGLDGASPTARRAALREAEANGQNFTVTSSKDALGAPPANQYTTETIQPNLTGNQTPNDGTQTPEQGAKESAVGQTAEQQANNNIPATATGAGQGNNSPTPIVSNGEQSLSSSELANLQTNTATAEASQEQPAATTATGNESKAVDVSDAASLRAKIDNAGNQSGTTMSIGNDSDNTGSSAVSQNIPSGALTNQLHNFTGYTYKISLFLLTSEDYQNLSVSPLNFYPRWTLISSGGGIPADAPRTSTSWHPDFQEDFYFDNLNFKTLVGLNSRSKGSNLMEIRFTIVEPYGMSLLDRLLSACQTSCDSANYIDQPYLLQIDFLANPSESNTNGISDHQIDRKRVAIKLTEFKIKPGVNGTTYSIAAIPYNHIAFDQSIAAVPVNLSVEATTVGDYFDSREELMRIFDQAATKEEQRIESEINKEVANYSGLGKDAQAELKRKEAQIRASSFYSTKSYPAGYNTYYKNVALQEGRTEQPLSQILFSIHPDIAKSPIIDTNAINSSSTPTNDPKSSAKAGTATGTNKDFKTKSVFQVMAGTDVVSLIDRVISSSKYVKDQIEKAKTADEQQAQQDTTSNDSNARSKQNDTNKKDTTKYQSTKWYKITPTVTLGLYDQEAQAYSKTITYSILPYQKGNFYHPDFKETKVKNKKCVRTYNYYYTGLNQDILQLDVDFDATFVTGITTFAKQLKSTNTSAGSDVQIEGDNNKAPSPSKKPSFPPRKKVATPSDTQMTGQKGRTPEDAIVGSVARSLYSSYPRGDMLNIKAKIVGDPAFIKQDDTLYQPTSKDYKDSVTFSSSDTTPPVNPTTGQIIFDSEEVYVQLIVKGVIDIDDKTGITNKTITLSNGQVANGSFSGVYRVMAVTSEFSKGKFEQTLELIRVPDDLVEIENAPGTSVTTQGTTQSAASTAAEASLPGIVPGPINIANIKPENVPDVPQNLKDIANGPISNPIPGIQIQGRPFQDQVPSSAYPTNVNNTPFTI